MPRDSGVPPICPWSALPSADWSSGLHPLVQAAPEAPLDLKPAPRPRAAQIVSLTPRQNDQLETFLDYLLEVNKVMNLTGQSLATGLVQLSVGAPVSGISQFVASGWSSHCQPGKVLCTALGIQRIGCGLDCNMQPTGAHVEP